MQDGTFPGGPYKTLAVSANIGPMKVARLPSNSVLVTVRVTVVCAKRVDRSVNVTKLKVKTPSLENKIVTDCPTMSIDLIGGPIRSEICHVLYRITLCVLSFFPLLSPYPLLSISSNNYILHLTLLISTTYLPLYRHSSIIQGAQRNSLEGSLFDLGPRRLFECQVIGADPNCGGDPDCITTTQDCACSGSRI